MKRNAAVFVGLVAAATSTLLWLGAPTRAQDKDAAPIAQPVLMFKPLTAGAEIPGKEPETSNTSYFRAKVPGGWIVSNPPTGVFFFPDAKHAWDGGSID